MTIRRVMIVCGVILGGVLVAGVLYADSVVSPQINFFGWCCAAGSSSPNVEVQEGSSISTTIQPRRLFVPHDPRSWQEFVVIAAFNSVLIGGVVWCADRRYRRPRFRLVREDAGRLMKLKHRRSLERRGGRRLRRC